MNTELIDRMAIAIVDGSQARRLIAALTAAAFPVTLVDSSGGLLHDSLETLLVGVPQQRLEGFMALVREHCPSRTRYVPVGVELALAPGCPTMIEARVGGATIFVTPVEQFLQL